jgi:hypothetical protein
MAMESDCPAYLWREVVNTTTYLTNRSPTHSNGGLSLEHVYNGKAPKFNHLRVFGSLVYVHVSKSRRSKLEAKSIKCMMVGMKIDPKHINVLTQRKKVLIN